MTPQTMFLVSVQFSKSLVPLSLPRICSFISAHARTSIRLSVHPSTHPCVRPSVCPSIHLPILRCSSEGVPAPLLPSGTGQMRSLPSGEPAPQVQGGAVPILQRGSFHILAQFTAGLASPEWPLGHKRKVSSGQIGGQEYMIQGPGSPPVSPPPPDC